MVTQRKNQVSIIYPPTHHPSVFVLFCFPSTNNFLPVGQAADFRKTSIITILSDRDQNRLWLPALHTILIRETIKN